MRTTSPLVLLLFFFLGCAPVQNGGNAFALDGTRWTHAASPAITLQFADGSATGSGGCNQYRATYTVSGTSLTFGPAAATKRACLEPEGNRRETEYLDALTRVASYTASEERLTLRDAAGATLVELTRQR